MAAKRRDIREAAFLLSFEKLFRDDSLEEIFEIAKEMDVFPVFSESEVLTRGVFEKADELDSIISKYSNKRAIDRIPKINLAILRLALYEALYDDKVPLNVAISEAVSLAQRFAQEPDIAFINGVLGSYSRSDEAPMNVEAPGNE